MWPPSLAPRVRAVAGKHPITGPVDASAWAWVPEDLLARSIAGVERRGRLIEHLLREQSPDVFITVFNEVHGPSHILWHTAPRVGSGSGTPQRPNGPALVDLFREVDRQIGRVLRLAGDEAAILVFSLFGMRGIRGLPRLLDPLSQAVELATPLSETVFARLKRQTPTTLKRLCQRFVPPAVMLGLAKFDLTPRYDWSRTKAFPLPTDQHGWIRVNLKGREAEGIVERSEYDRLCGEIERFLYDLQMEDGTPVVRGVVWTAPDYPAGIPGRLPDLVVHWTAATSAGPIRLRTPAIHCELGAPKLTGQHAPDGFWVFRSPRLGGPVSGASIATQALGRLLIDQLATS